MRFRSKSPITHQGQLYGDGASSGKRGGRLGGPKRKEGSAPSHLASRSYHHSAPPLASSAHPSCQWQGQPHGGLSTSTLLRVSPWRCTAPASGTWALNTPAPPCEPPGPQDCLRDALCRASRSVPHSKSWPLKSLSLFQPFMN